MTLEALEDVDAGRVIDHQGIQVWADSLGTDKSLPRRSDEDPLDQRRRRTLCVCTSISARSHLRQPRGWSSSSL
nr:hypothetical protein [Sphingomonas sp. CDS-1]